MVSDERMERALVYLAKTDQEAAELKVQMLRREYAVDLARRREFLNASGNIEARKALAETSESVQHAIGNYCDAVGEYEKVRAKRTTEALIVEVFRTVSANRRQGNIT